MLNNVCLMGRLTADPELKRTTNSIAVCSFSIAVNRSFAKSGEERKADFINIVAWRGTAEFVVNYFKKGDLIAIQGSIQTRNYEDKNGNKRTAFEVVASQVSFCGGKTKTPVTPIYEQLKEPTSEIMSFSVGSDDDFIEITNDENLPF